MPRIPWTTYSGDDVEAYAAMCIYREHASATRIRPSVGDGGIDVYVPLGGNKVDVYQVKKYAENLKAKQFSDITKSYDKIKMYAKDRKWEISTWYLVMPLDPTKENDEWFEELNRADTFDAKWRGLSVFNNWAADYPQVADHFFNGGRDRLACELARFTNATSILLPGVDTELAKRSFDALEPATVLDRIALLNATLNDSDPYYQYQISVGPDAAAPPYNAQGGYPAVVATYSRPVEDQTVTVHVFARFAESLTERPITFKATVVVPTGGDEEREWRQFLDYGRPPSKPVTIRDLVVDLPGGLGDNSEEAFMRILPVDDGMESYERVLRVLDPSGGIVGEVQVRFTERGYSADNTGAFVRGADTSGMLTVEILSKINDGTIDVTYNFKLADDTGRNPRDVRSAIAFTNGFFAPNRLKVADPRVPRRAFEQPIPAAEPGGDDRRFADQYVRYLDALLAIQEYADDQIVIPDATLMNTDDHVAIMRAARLLAGETVELGWDALTLTLDPGAPLIDDDGAHALVADLPLVVAIGAQRVLLGIARHTFEAGEVSERNQNEDGSTKVVMRPAFDKNKVKVMWAGEESIDYVQQSSSAGSLDDN